MPIYEFYCVDCHTVFRFLSRRVETGKRPACPRCERPRLERRASTFAIGSGRREDEGDALPEGIDAARMERAMGGLAREAEGVDDDDPRAMAGLMHRFYEQSGVAMGEGMAEALDRLAAGEDPETIEAEMGEVLEGEDPFAGRGPTLRRLGRRARPSIDPELHEM